MIFVLYACVTYLIAFRVKLSWNMPSAYYGHLVGIPSSPAKRPGNGEGAGPDTVKELCLATDLSLHITK